MNKKIKNSAYIELLGTIKARITSAQYEALKAVNKELVNLYWDIGQAITKRQISEGWGKSIVEQLAHDLHISLPKMRGFSASNLWRMRVFYDQYAKSTKLAPLVREIGWSNNL